MIQKSVSAAVASLVCLSLLAASGCLQPTAYGPNIGALGYPVPVTPFLQDALEDQAWEHERYETVPIMGPITEGSVAVALDPPSQDEIMRAFERARPLEGGFPLLHEIQRNNVRIVVEPIADYVDPPRVYPLIGPAQLHHAHYKCIIYFSEVTRVGWPIPYTTTNQDAQEVIYVDHNHFHMVGNVDTGPGAQF
jgi:hypothetical protein